MIEFLLNLYGYNCNNNQESANMTHQEKTEQ